MKERNIRLLRMLLENIPNVNVKILDVGCGNGTLSQVISQRVKTKVVGVDISPTLLKKAKARGIDAYEIDVCTQLLPFEDNKFDVAILARALEHLIDPDFAIKEIKRVLKKEGLLVLSTPNLGAWHNRLLLMLGLQPLFTEVSSKKVFGRKFLQLGEGNPAVGHLRIFTLNALKAFLSYYHFKINEIKGARFLEEYPVLNHLDKIFSAFSSLSSYILIVAINKKEVKEWPKN